MTLDEIYRKCLTMRKGEKLKLKFDQEIPTEMELATLQVRVNNTKGTNGYPTGTIRFYGTGHSFEAHCY